MLSVKVSQFLALTTLPVFLGTALQTAREPAALELGKPVERELAGNQAHEYHIGLGAGQYVHVIVDQRGIDVVVTLFGPDGKQIAEVDSPNGAQGPEPLSVVVEVPGTYRLSIRSLEKDAAGGRYAAEIKELRPATEHDRNRVRAQRASAEGQQLERRQAPEWRRKAIEKYELALRLFRAASDQRGEAEALNLIGGAWLDLEEYEKSLQFYRQALPLWRGLGDRRAEAAALNNTGANYGYLGERRKALESYGQALTLAKAAGDEQSEAALLVNIGGTYAGLGEPQKALEYLWEARGLLRALGHRGGEAAALNDLGELYGDLGEPQRALEFFLQALPLAKASGDKRREADTLNDIGVVCAHLGENQKALEYYRQALPLWKAVGDRGGEAATLNNIGSFYGRLGDHRKALDYYGQALPLAKAVGHLRGEAQQLANIGGAYRRLGDHQKALEYTSRALSLKRTLGDRQGEATALGNLAEAETALGEIDRARTHLEEALAILESLRSQIAGQQLRTSFLASVQGTYTTYIDLLMRLHGSRSREAFDTRAFEAAERTRARSLLEMLREARADIRQGVDAALLERERSLSRRLNTKAERLMRLLSGKPQEDQVAALKGEIGQLETEYQQVEAAIRKSSPRYAALTQPQPLTLREIQREVLDPGTLLLEYSLGKERSYVFAATPEALHSFELPKEEEIDKAARRVHELLTARNRRPKGESDEQRRARITQAEAQFPEAAAALSRMVLGPAASLLRDKRLLVVADGALQYLPFGALPDPRHPGTPLVVNHEVVNVPSASVLALLRRETTGRKPPPMTLAVLADPVFDTSDPRVGGRQAAGASALRDIELERAAVDTGAIEEGLRLPRLVFTRQEAEGIYRLARPGQATKALDFEANLTRATSSELARYRMVHIASHGLVNTERPALSGLVLSLVDEKGQPQNGFLKLRDVYNLNLPADLVVLSACQTGLGKEIRGEGLVGLVRGFMYAGTQRVVASLWKVDDVATTLLMERFYRSMLAEKLRPAAALRRAQVAMWRQPRWSSPYYWAAFTLQGEWK